MKPAVVWIGIIVGLLTLSLATQGVLIFHALRDPSFAVEPDYEWKAAHWDQIARARAASAALGWTIDLRATAADEPGHVDVVVTVADRDGAPVGDAEVRVEAFHNARADRRLARRLPETEAGGSYGQRLPIRRSGLWEFRLEVARGEERFLETVRKSVLSTPRVSIGSVGR